MTRLPTLALAAALALTAGGPAYAASGPRCDVDGIAGISGMCMFGHHDITSLRVTATASGVPGLTAVRITLHHVDVATGRVGDLVLECHNASSDLTDSTADCAGSAPWSGAGAFLCRIEGSVYIAGTCEASVAG